MVDPALRGGTRCTRLVDSQRMRLEAVGRLAMTSALIASCAQQAVPPRDSQPTAVQPSYPAPIPPSCAVSPMRFERREGFGAYWIDGLKLAAGLPTGVLREGENKIQWQGESGDLGVGGQSLDGIGTVQLLNPVRLGVGIYSTSTVFAHAGCWRLTASMGAGSFDAVVYVFPK